MSLELRARFGEREVGAEPGDRFELVERAAGVAERAARHHRHDDAERRDERREHERHLVADAARRMLVDARPSEVREFEPVAARQHGLGERRGLGAIEAAEKTRHEQRGHLVVGHVALGVGRGRARATRRARCARRRASARSGDVRALSGTGVGERVIRMHAESLIAAALGRRAR